MAYTTENLYVGDGTTVLYSFTFPYIQVRDIYVSIDGVDQTLTTEYTLANATTIEFVVAPTAASAIRIYRNTDTTDVKSVFYPGSAIRAQDLNNNFTQNLYVTQEASFGSNTATGDAAAAKASAELAASDAASAAQDAASAQESAEQAGSDAAAAIITSAQALTSASAAEVDAAAAEVKADQALASVLEVVPFTLVTNVAAIPASVGDGEGIRVGDSTGIESFSPLTGLPAGFVGDPGIYVDITRNNTASTWVYTRYNANDPDSRYAGGLDGLSKSGGTMTGDIIFADTQDFPEIDLNSFPSLP